MTPRTWFSLAVLAAAVLLTGYPARQEPVEERVRIALQEHFDGAFPPAGWRLVNHNGAPSRGWAVERTDFPTLAAEHEDEFGYPSDDSLQTPVIDLSDCSRAYLHFQSLTWFASFQASHPDALGDGVSTLEVSVDGGATFTEGFWTSSQLRSGVIEDVTVDLSAFAGESGVVLRFGYRGTFAHNWVVDAVQVTDSPRLPPPPPRPPALWARSCNILYA